MEINSTDLLFVYGTLLLPDNNYAKFLRNNAVFLAAGKFPGELFELGSYPGAVYVPHATEFVSGGVFRMSNSSLVLQELDNYEGLNHAGCEYARSILPIETTNGLLNCWTYVYCLSSQGKIKIAGGDYLKYLEK